MKLVTGAPTIVFLTVCTKDRTPWLACKGVHDLLRLVFRDATAWRVGRYVVMPDHLHLFAGFAESRFSLDKWVTYWKSDFSRRYQRAECRWQTDHWDTRLRTSAAYDEKLQYTLENPVRRGLVTNRNDWPYQGEIFPLRWD